MLTKTTLALAVMCAAATLANPGFAQGGPGNGIGDLFMGPPPELAALDTDGDGKVSKTEMQAGQAIIQTARAEEFKIIDTDGDGYSTLEELQAWVAGKIAARFTTRDTDGNGALSLEEFTGGKTGQMAVKSRNIYRLIDTNGDSALSPDEFTTAAAQATNPLFHFAQLDRDGDGKVSAAEYTTPPRRRGPGPGNRGPGQPQ